MPDYPLSEPAATFWKHLGRFLAFLGFIRGTVVAFKVATDDVIGPLHSAPETFDLRSVKRKLSKAMSVQQVEDALKPLAPHEGLLNELLFCNSIDNFFNYVSDLLTLILTLHPEMLKSDEKISVEMVLQYADRAELLAALTERKVQALLFKGMGALNDEVEKKYGFALFEDNPSLSTAVVMVEKRNLITHNRGRVNRKYLERVGAATDRLGDILRFEPADITVATNFLIGAVFDIDKRAAAKFGVPLETIVGQNTETDDAGIGS